MLKNKVISTQFVEEEIVIDMKFVDDGSDRMMLIDNRAPRSIVSSKWFNGYLKDAKVSEEEVKKKAYTRNLRMRKTVFLVKLKLLSQWY